jgi:dolichol kinase
VLGYYLLPSHFYWVPAWWAIPLGALVLATLEGARLRLGFSLPTLRARERPRVASYVYWGAALAVLVAFFPEDVAVAALLAGALLDIAASASRARGSDRPRGRAVGATIFLLVSLGLFLTLGTEPADVTALMAVVGAGLGGLVEGRRWPGLDDDLLVPLLPALAWIALSHVVPGAVPLGFHLPWVSRG